MEKLLQDHPVNLQGFISGSKKPVCLTAVISGLLACGGEVLRFREWGVALIHSYWALFWNAAVLVTKAFLFALPLSGTGFEIYQGISFHPLLSTLFQLEAALKWKKCQETVVYSYLLIGKHWYSLQGACGMGERSPCSSHYLTCLSLSTGNNLSLKAYSPTAKSCYCVTVLSAPCAKRSANTSPAPALPF